MESFKLYEACKLTRRLYVDNQPKPDLAADYEAVQAWLFAPTIYSGIEQALKQIILLKTSRDEGDSFNREALLADLRSRTYGHNISNLFERLKWCAAGCRSKNGCQSTMGCQSQSSFLCAREHIEHHYREHASLWNNCFVQPLHDTAEEFIRHISDGRDGYMKWRYLLIEPERVPMLSLWTMLEIWHGACCHIMTHMEDRMGGPSSCYSLSSRLNWFFDDLWPKVGSEGHEWAAWRNSHNNPLHSWIDMLVAADRDALHEIDMPPIRRGSLEETAHDALQQLEELAQIDPSPQPSRARAEHVRRGRRTAGHVERPDAEAILRNIRRSDEQFVWASTERGFALRPLSGPRFNSGVTVTDERSVQAGDLLIGDSITVPGLGVEPWEVPDNPSGATATLLAGLALCELGQVDIDNTTTLDDSYRLIPDLGRAQWVVEKVTAVQRKRLPVRERWIEAVRDGGTERLRIQLRDNQTVLLGDQAESLSFTFAPAQYLGAEQLENLNGAGYECRVWIGSGVPDRASSDEAAVLTMSENLVTIALEGCKSPSGALQTVKEVLTLIGLDGDSAEFENINGRLLEVLALADRTESDHFARLSIRADGRCPVGRIARSDHFDIGAMLLRSDPFPTS